MGIKRTIEDKDLYKTLDCHKSKKIGDRMQDLWDRELTKKNPSFMNVLYKTYAARVLGISVLYTLIDVVLKWVVDRMLW